MSLVKTYRNVDDQFTFSVLFLFDRDKVTQDGELANKYVIYYTLIPVIPWANVAVSISPHQPSEMYV